MGSLLKNIDTGNDQSILREPRIRKLVKIELFTDSSGPYDALIRTLYFRNSCHCASPFTG
jgi:hypothetical protein